MRDAVLQEVVVAMLSDPSLEIETIAICVGFSDPAALSKAFRRSTGATPVTDRRKILASTLAPGGGAQRHRNQPR